MNAANAVNVAENEVYTTIDSNIMLGIGTDFNRIFGLYDRS